jgi:subtilisin family serine protease
MQSGNSLRRKAGNHAIAVLTLACSLIPATAAAAATRPSGGDLSPRLEKLARPSVQAASPARQAKVLSLARSGPGSLLREGNRVLVEVRFDRGAAAAVGDLRAAGAKILNVSPRYQTVTVALKPGQLTGLNGIPRVAGASEVLTPITSSSTCPAGVAVSEGDTQLRADEARSTFGVDGAGVTVGILSDSFDRDETAETRQSGDVESGDLPGVGNTCPGQTTPVGTTLDDYEPNPEEPAAEDEGRAMAQIVHDLAPRAQLSFATAFTGLTAFAENIEALASAGAKVIADDVSYFEEPFFQEGPVGSAISKVTADDDVAYFSAAGNNNLISGGKNIASWEAPAFRDAGSCPVGVPVYATHCMDFNPEAPVDTSFGIRVLSGATLRLDLQWNQPWNGVTTDLDAYLLSSTDKLLASSEEPNATSTQTPFEFIPWKNTTGTAQTVRLAINRCDSVCGGASGGDTGTPRLKFAMLQNGGGVTETEYPESIAPDKVGPTIFGHTGGEDAMSVGAIRYNATAAPEVFSSRGPVTHYFEPADGVTPAAPLLTPQEISKPDIVATDGGANTFFGSCVSHTWRFFGTSAAAPHAASVAALERQAVPTATATEVKQAQLATAEPVGAFPPEAVGAGIVNAAATIANLKSEPLGEPIFPTAPIAPENCELPEPPAIKEGEEKIVIANPPTEPAVPPEAHRPQTRFLRHPAKIVRTDRRAIVASFRFGADVGSVTFVCRVDAGVFHRCESRFVRSFAVGPHVVRVFARNAAGADLTPAVYRFRVMRVPSRR